MSKRREKEDRFQTDGSVAKKLDRMRTAKENGDCTICPPNRGENARRRAKHGPRPPREKNRPNDDITPGLYGGWF